MKKAIKIIVIIVLAVFVLIQFIRPDKNNPAIDPAQTLEASVQVPADVQAVLSRSCADCHTNQTYYPWYAQIAPVSWLLADHVRDGRKELNLSVWNTYADRKKAKKFEEICEQLNQGEMPLPSYLWIHRDAALSDSDRTLLCDWAKSEKAKFGQ